MNSAKRKSLLSVSFTEIPQSSFWSSWGLRTVPVEHSKDPDPFPLPSCPPFLDTSESLVASSILPGCILWLFCVLHCHMSLESPEKLAPFSILEYNTKDGEKRIYWKRIPDSSFLDLALTPSVALRRSCPVSLVSLPHLAQERWDHKTSKALPRSSKMIESTLPQWALEVASMELTPHGWGQVAGSALRMWQERQGEGRAELQKSVGQSASTLQKDRSNNKEGEKQTLYTLIICGHLKIPDS